MFRRIAIWGQVLYAFFATFGGVSAAIASPEQTVTLVQNGKSLIRFGDGEFSIYRKKSIHYQPWSEALQADFLRIKERFEEERENCPYLLAVPKHFMQCSGFALSKKRVYVSSWAQSRRYFKNYFRRKDLRYGDAFLFEKKNKQLYAGLWQGEHAPKRVVFVHNNPQYAALFTETYGIPTRFVPVPPHDAYAEIDRIQTDIRQALEEFRKGNDSVQVVISAGPAGKVLVYRLSEQGVHCVDAGHCWDDPLET